MVLTLRADSAHYVIMRWVAARGGRCDETGDEKRICSHQKQPPTPIGLSDRARRRVHHGEQSRGENSLEGEDLRPKRSYYRGAALAAPGSSFVTRGRGCAQPSGP